MEAILFLSLFLILFLVLWYRRKISKLKNQKDVAFQKELEQKYEMAIKLQNERLERELEEKEEFYKKKYQDLSSQYNKELNEIQSTLNEFREKRKAIHEDSLRKRKILEEESFYKIQLTPEDIEDILLLKSVASRLRHRELIPKLIWDSLVSRPTTEMIKRVVGNKVGGIYKITYLHTGESYIGRTVNFKDRWKNHVQTALGLEKSASSTLHTHMEKNGIWNYSFEILEECGKDIQNEREKFYIDLYGTKQELNMRAGG